MIVITLNIYDDSYYIKYISTCSYLLLCENQEWTFHILCLSDYIYWITHYRLKLDIKGILSTNCVIFSYPKLLSISVLTFIK